jgi:hypothetical protein
LVSLATLLLLAMLAQTAIAPMARAAATLQPDLRRGLAAVGPRTSDEPALRLERQAGEPSPGFALGAALGAWTNAAATLDYDLKTPSGDGGDAETIELDCYDEKLMLSHLETRRQAAGLTPQQVLSGAGVTDRGLLAAWRARLVRPLTACR